MSKEDDSDGHLHTDYFLLLARHPGAVKTRTKDKDRKTPIEVHHRAVVVRVRQADACREKRAEYVDDTQDGCDAKAAWHEVFDGRGLLFFGRRCRCDAVGGGRHHAVRRRQYTWGRWWHYRDYVVR